MKGRSLILIFLFLALIINPVYCESGNGSIDTSIVSDADKTFSVGGDGTLVSIVDFLLTLNHDTAGDPDSYYIDNIDLKNDSEKPYGSIPGNLGDPFYIYWSETGVGNDELVGYGSVLIHKKSYESSDNVVEASIIFYFDEFTKKAGVSGTQKYRLDGSWSGINTYYDNYYRDSGTPYKNQYYSNLGAVISYVSPLEEKMLSHKTGYSNIKHEFSSWGTFRNDYDYNVTSAYFDIDIQRQGFNESYDLSSTKIKMENYTDDTVYYQSGFTTANTSHFLNVGSYNYYIVRQIDDYEHLIYTYSGDEDEDEGEDHTAVIEFNQSFYTDPEDIQVSWDVDSFDSGAYTYEIQVITSVSGNPSQDSWPADGNWNVSPFISSASGAAVFDFYSAGYDLPIWIQGELWAQDKGSGTWTKLDNTPAVIYHEAALEAGKVWTDKESYNVTEIVTIYTDTVDGGYLMIDKRNDPLYDSYNIYSGLSHVKFSLQTSHVGTWDVYLYENSIITNSTVFTVLADNDTAYFSWWGDVQKGEAAFYDYVATSSNSVVSIYDGVGEKQYSFNATAGYNEGQISTMPGEAGNWTGSLYDGGVYYNSSLEVYASESWIRFVDDSYYLGDTIEIEYFIVEDWCKIRLKDGLCQYGGRSTILTWMPGSFHTGQRGTLEFTLSDDNEFGLQVETNLESGYYLPGEWRVEALFETEKGYAFVDDTTYVHDAAKEDAGDPAAVSNEMIGIFFSPQGIFLMFVVIITVMGLAVTKQPAGGAVCAVMGVGFGRFFNVLPTWMLLLTIIALVAFAGVSTAIYIKGK